MKIFLKLLLAGLLAFSLAAGCKKKTKEPQAIIPDKAGERGTSCQAKNDCAGGLSCIGGICNYATFDVESTGKACYRVECAETADCCGDKPINPPTKCRERTAVCEPTVPGCPSGNDCTSADDCNGGTCSGLYCSATFSFCTTDESCVQDECEFTSVLGGTPTGYCSLSSVTCTSNADCTMANNCGGPSQVGECTCSNINYDPSNPICSDEDCDNVCTKVCENELCVEDNGCEDDTECFGVLSICEEGECVECVEDTDCDSVADENDDEDVCREGICVTPCKGDSECPMFSECQEGECIYTGCKTDRECVLTRVSAESGDPRLAICKQKDGIGYCTIECEIDAHCSLDEVCVDGACEYIGCNDDSECKSILGLNNWESSEDIPWIPEGQCREPMVVSADE